MTGIILILFISGVKSISDVMASSARMQHILHGDSSGGLHHISGLINDPTKKVVEMFGPNAKGVYKVRYELPDGSLKLSIMFPNSKSEIQVAKSIESVFINGNKNGNIITGVDATGINFEIVLYPYGSTKQCIHYSIKLYEYIFNKIISKW